LDLRSASQDTSLLEALEVVVQHHHARRNRLTPALKLRFASQRWRNFVLVREQGEIAMDRRSLEVCVFLHVADALRSGDLYVVGSQSYADYRTQLLSWDDCRCGLDEYCEQLGLPKTGALREALTQVARQVDTGFPENSQLTIDSDGVPHLKRQKATPLPEGLLSFESMVHERMPERHLLDILKHIRYGKYGGINYQHISSTYIALFTNFIACGVWEAVYILDALLLNTSDLQPDTLHADTHGQSEPVFGLAHLLGIELLPRMRTWNDAVLYRPSKTEHYKHIDALFSDVIDWDLIERHWQDMMQVALSVQAGKILPSMLLRKLGSHNRKNKLYRAFRELGRVLRTLFLLRFVSETDLRQTIRAETTKIESFNDFLDWISFGGPVIKSGDPVEQTKRLKYANLVANAIMLQNVADLTGVLNTAVADGYPVTQELVGRLSPYMRKHIHRFGQYVLDMDAVPEPLDPSALKLELSAVSKGL
jgi:TnpA family transposase